MPTGLFNVILPDVQSSGDRDLHHPATAAGQATSRPFPYPTYMTVQILQTKLYIPTSQPDTQCVLRPRLLERLDAALNQRLTLLSAPAGSGKTTLLSEWIGSKLGSRDQGVESRAVRENASPPTSYSLPPTPRFSWLSLDQHDSDPARFWTYLIAALQTGSPNVGQRQAF